MLRIRKGKLTRKGFLKEVSSKLREYKKRSMNVPLTVLCSEDNNPVDLLGTEKSFRGAVDSGYRQRTYPAISPGPL